MPRALDHVSFTVSDLDRSIEFYCVLFGSKPLSEGVETSHHASRVIGYDPLELRFAWFAIPGTPTYLELFEYVVPRTEGGELQNSRVGNGHLGLVVDDIEAECDRLAAAGATFASDGPVTITDGSWGGSRVIYMRDPDGITVELMESPPGPELRFRG